MQDQRSIARPVGGACGIGAVEGAGPTATPLALVVDSPDDGDDAAPGDGSCDIDGGAVEPGDCTLRAVIAEANARGGPDDVAIAPGVDPVLSIAGPSEDRNATGDIDVRDSLALDLGGATVDAAGIDRVLDHHGRSLIVHDGTLTGGSAPTATAGGGVRHLSGPLTILRMVVRGNAAASGGGVAAVSGPTTIEDAELTGNDPIADNTAPGTSGSAVRQTGGTVSVGGSIVSGVAPACAGTFVSLGHNRATPTPLWPTTRPCLTPIAAVGDIAASGVDLGPLTDNGGPTRTRLPGAGSTAIDAIAVDTPELCDGGLTTDQRGVPRPQGTACDAGAVEQ